MRFYKLGDFYHYESDNFDEYLHASAINIREMDGGYIRFSLDLKGRSTNLDVQERFLPSEVLDREGVAYGSTVADVLREVNTGTNVNHQDQTTPAIIVHFNKTLEQTTMTAGSSIGTYDITVASTTNAAVQRYVIIHNQTEARWQVAHISAINGSVLTLDRPLEFSFPSGTHVDYCLINMNVDGSVTPQIFGVRGVETGKNVDVDIDITRIIFLIKTTGIPTLSKFGDLTTLLNGVHVRKRDGKNVSLFNIKNNGELAGLAYDIEFYSSSNPTQAQNGLISRLTFAGTEKMGVVQRLGPGDDLEIIIQDDLRLLLEFEVTAQGHVVEKY